MPRWLFWAFVAALLVLAGLLAGSILDWTSNPVRPPRSTAIYG